jgi:hypothetical protein
MLPPFPETPFSIRYVLQQLRYEGEEEWQGEEEVRLDHSRTLKLSFNELHDQKKGKKENCVTAG